MQGVVIPVCFPRWSGPLDAPPEDPRIAWAVSRPGGGWWLGVSAELFAQPPRGDGYVFEAASGHQLMLF